MIDQQEQAVVSVIATGIAEVALLLHVDFQTVTEHRHALGKALCRFADNYCQARGLYDLGLNTGDYTGDVYNLR